MSKKKKAKQPLTPSDDPLHVDGGRQQHRVPRPHLRAGHGQEESAVPGRLHRRQLQDQLRDVRVAGEGAAGRQAAAGAGSRLQEEGERPHYFQHIYPVYLVILSIFCQSSFIQWLTNCTLFSVNTFL